MDDDTGEPHSGVDRLAGLRPLLRAEIDRVVAQANELQGEVFNVRKGGPITAGLIEMLDTQRVTIQTLCAQVGEAEQDARRPAGARRL